MMIYENECHHFKRPFPAYFWYSYSWKKRAPQQKELLFAPTKITTSTKNPPTKIQQQQQKQQQQQ